MCDHTGMTAGRTAAWPRFVPTNRQNRATDKRILEVSQYFDCVNFARKAKAQAFFSVGFIDRTCPPTTVYAAYNVYAGPKEILNMIRTGHKITREYTSKQQPFLSRVMGFK